MRNTTILAFAAAGLFAGFQVCFGDNTRISAGNPPLSITKSNDNVILTWPQTSGDWLLLEFTHFDECYVSNDVIYCEVYPRKVISSSNYRTDGTNISVVLPIDFSTNKFYELETNLSLIPPIPMH